MQKASWWFVLIFLGTLAVLFTFWISSQCFIKARVHKNTCPLVCLFGNYSLGLLNGRTQIYMMKWWFTWDSAWENCGGVGCGLVGKIGPSGPRVGQPCQGGWDQVGPRVLQLWGCELGRQRQGGTGCLGNSWRRDWTSWSIFGGFSSWNRRKNVKLSHLDNLLT